MVKLNVIEDQHWTIKGLAGHKKRTKHLRGPKCELIPHKHTNLTLFWCYKDNAGRIIKSGGPQMDRMLETPKLTKRWSNFNCWKFIQQHLLRILPPIFLLPSGKQTFAFFSVNFILGNNVNWWVLLLNNNNKKHFKMKKRRIICKKSSLFLPQGILHVFFFSSSLFHSWGEKKKI